MTGQACDRIASVTMSGTGSDDREESGPTSTPPPSAHRPSPIFLALVGGAIVSGWALWSGIGPPAIMSFVFVLLFWIVSLSLHEFAHALVAYRNGDVTVVANTGAASVQLPAGDVLLSSEELVGRTLPGDATAWLRSVEA